MSIRLCIIRLQSSLFKRSRRKEMLRCRLRILRIRLRFSQIKWKSKTYPSSRKTKQSSIRETISLSLTISWTHIWRLWMRRSFRWINCLRIIHNINRKLRKHWLMRQFCRSSLIRPRRSLSIWRRRSNRSRSSIRRSLVRRKPWKKDKKLLISNSEINLKSLRNLKSSRKSSSRTRCTRLKMNSFRSKRSPSNPSARS